MRFSVEQLNPAMREQAKQKLAMQAGTVRTVKALDEPNRVAAARATAKEPKPNKYGARRIEVEGVKFDSKHEYQCFAALRFRLRAGEITDLRCQVRFSLFDAGGHCRGEHIGTYRADFVYREGGKLVVADAKSAKTRTLRDWPRTKALLRACHGHEVVEL